MEWHLFTIGKPSLSYARDGYETYAKRIQRWARIDHQPLRKSQQIEESNQLLSKSTGMLRIALDERGESLTTRQWSERIRDLHDRNVGSRRFAFLVGGADGHTEELCQSADAVWSLSSLTLQHELALVVLAEQIYRVHSLWEGMPYHRD